MKLSIESNEAEGARLRDEAARLGVRPEGLARAALADLPRNENQDFRDAAEVNDTEIADQRVSRALLPSPTFHYQNVSADSSSGSCALDGSPDPRAVWRGAA
jgi:hypothetical protein